MSGAAFEPIGGRYLRLNLFGQEHRIYVEEAGRGIPLLCLHMAGSDTRQYRAVLNDPAILERFRMVSFDLPYHGKSSPPATCAAASPASIRRSARSICCRANTTTRARPRIRATSRGAFPGRRPRSCRGSGISR